MYETVTERWNETNNRWEWCGDGNFSNEKHEPTISDALEAWGTYLKDWCTQDVNANNSIWERYRLALYQHDGDRRLYYSEATLSIEVDEKGVGTLRVWDNPFRDEVTLPIEIWRAS